MLTPRRIATLAEHADATRRLSRSITDRQKLRTWIRQRARCNACGAIVTLTDADLDHVRPLVDGGGLEDDNVQVLHRTPCHKDKTSTEMAMRSKQSGRMDVQTEPKA